MNGYATLIHNKDNPYYKGKENGWATGNH
jgi:hypothetical protein